MKDGNNFNPAIIVSFDNEVDAISSQINAAEAVLNELLKTYPQAFRDLEEMVIDNYDDAMTNTKKTAGVDVIRVYVAHKSKENKEKYLKFCELEATRKVIERILDAQKTRMSGVQSKMKISF